MTNNEKFVRTLKALSGGDKNTFNGLWGLAEENMFDMDDLEDSEYEYEVKKFLREIVMPGIKGEFANSKNEGDKKYWSDFGKRVQGQLGDGFSRSWEELKKKYGKPLQMSDADIAWEAEQQFTSPEIIKTEIDKAWAAHAKEEGRKSRERMELQTAKDRAQLQKDFESGKLDGQTTFGDGAIGTAAGWAARKIGYGLLAKPFAHRVVEQNKRNVIQGTDESVIDDAAVDLGQGIVESVAGHGLFKGIGKFAPGMNSMSKTLFTNGGAVGIGNFGGQIADIARGEQDEYHFGETAAAAGIGAGLGGISGVFLGWVNKLLNNPETRAYGIAMLRKLRGKNVEIPKTKLEQEHENFRKIVDEAVEARKAAITQRGEHKGAYKKNATNQVKARSDAAEEKASVYADDPRVVRNNEAIDKIVAEAEGEIKYVKDNGKPLPQEEEEAIRKQIKKENAKRKVYPDAPPTNKEISEAYGNRGKNQDYEYYKKVYPESVNEFIHPSPAPKAPSKIGVGLIEFGPAAVNAGQIAASKTAGIVEDKKRKESDEEKHERWQNGYATLDEMKSDEYKGWKEQLREGWRY